MKFNLVPKNDKYFEDFNGIIDIVRRIARELLQAVEGDRIPADIWRRVKSLEREADGVVKRITTRLEQSFITPIEREDIHLLAVTIDDVADSLCSMASRFETFEIETPNDDLRAMLRALDQMCEQMVIAVHELRTLDAGPVREATAKVDTLEETIDELYRLACKRLFHRRPEAYDLVRWKEVYDLLEEAADHGRHVARTVNHIVVRHS